MKYINGKSVLPKELLNKIQVYVEGEIVYIPKKDEKKKKWGEKSGTREYLAERNMSIYELYESGSKINEISEKFHLSTDSIKKIIYNTNSRKTNE
ncbi:MAG: hypothetical protein JXQ23_08240 [Clostridia bacterium]|nr:hypothetical protein [Clostridia bacterium]